MKLSLAPMEGITTHVFRRALHRHFGGVDIFFTPFIAAAHTNARERRDLLPENNPGMHVIPQMLTDSVSDLVSLAGELKKMGFTELNLNFGCPSNTVVRGGRGAGFLARPDNLRSFLDGAFSACPLPLSAKTRIGYRDPAEWEGLLHIYADFPFTSLTVHARTGVMMYSGEANPAYALQAAERLPFPVIYNGDIRSPEDYEEICSVLGKSGQSPLPESPTGLAGTHGRASAITRIMIGRGLITNPALASRIKSKVAGTPSMGSSTVAADILQDPRFPAFHDDLLAGYGQEGLPMKKQLAKMKELWAYFFQQSSVDMELRRKIFSALTLPEYEAAVSQILNR